MRKALAAVVALALTACGQEAAITELARCNRELGSTDQHIAQAQAAQAAAERKAQALEEQLQAAREELAAARGRQGDGGAKPAAVAEAAAALAPPPPAPEPAGRRGQATLRVGLSLATQQEERWVKDKLTMLAEARKRGIDLRVQVAGDDAARQLAQAENLISQGIKVLILAPHDASGAAAIVDKAARAGVQVISYDRLVLDSPHDYYYLSFDNVKVGEIQGEYLTHKVPKGNYLILSGSPTDNNAKLFHQGAMKFVKPLVDRGDVKVLLDESVAGWVPAEAQKLCEKVLASGARVDAVLAPNDGTASGCIQALAAHGLAGKVPVTGQDAELAAAVRINQGTQSMTIFKDTRLLGRYAVEMAELLARGKAVETGGRTVNNNKRQVKSVLLTPYLVTRENLDERLIQSGYLNKAAVYRK